MSTCPASVYHNRVKFDKVALFVLADFETTGVNPDYDYPIQVAVHITDRHLNVLDTMSSYINLNGRAPGLFEHHGIEYVNADKVPVDHEALNSVRWSPKGIDAFEFHGIPASTIVDPEKSSDPDNVVCDINSRIRDCRCMLDSDDQDKRVILTSDNIWFEYTFMRMLYTSHQLGVPLIREWPFHYCGWDTSMLLELTGVRDPDGNPHDAVYDVSLLHTHLVRAFERVGYYVQPGYPYDCSD